jgi:hypothetical protein
MLVEFQSRWQISKQRNEAHEKKHRSGLCRPKFAPQWFRKETSLKSEAVEKAGDIQVPKKWQPEVKTNLMVQYNNLIKFWQGLKATHAKMYRDRAGDSEWFPELRDGDQNVGLGLAAQSGSLECCKIMLANRVDFNTQNSFGSLTKHAG